MKPSRAAFLSVALAAALLVPGPAPAQADSNGPDIDVANVNRHLQRLLEAAQNNEGHRAHGSDGYWASIRYFRNQLKAAGYSTRVQTFTHAGQTGYNLIADLPGGQPLNTVMIGAHLDSVTAGPGINDNGSGSAAILEVALRLAASPEPPTRHVRFAWWGAEELGLIGSTHYVESLSDGGNHIHSYYNFDMVASPNTGYFLYDGDNSDNTGAGPGPAGSAYLEQVLQMYYDDIGVPTEGTDFDGRSDYGPFIDQDIPAGGIFTGAEGNKTAAQALKWGGTAGDPFDPCYHDACDDRTNVSKPALNRNADAIAHAVWTVARVGDVIQPPPLCAEVNTSGSLSSGGNDYRPSTSGFTTGAGTIRGCLDGPASADFDLYLQRLNGATWTTVSSGTSAEDDETVIHNATGGTYRWRIHAWSGSGAWTLGYDLP